MLGTIKQNFSIIVKIKRIKQRLNTFSTMLDVLLEMYITV